MLELRGVRIDEVIEIDKNIRTVVFEAAQLSIGSSVTFDEGNEYISISQSKG
ncbi:hypothetical protein VCUG_00228, partial [Vavraia culicis subsp. floridensis]